MGSLPGWETWLLLIAITTGWGGMGAGAGEMAPATSRDGQDSARDVDGPLPDLVMLAPGTRIDRTVPAGWSHLVIKSIPRLASGDLDSLPKMATTTATLFRTVFLADVRPDGEGVQRRYRLRRIGLGLCTTLRGRDTVIRTSTLSSQETDLGFMGRTVLERGEQEMRRGRLDARTPTFALFTAPTMMQVGDGHREVLLRYALLVDPTTGSLQTMTWAVSADPDGRAAARTLVLLKPGLVYHCDLDVAAARILGTVPVGWSFAMKSLPPGQPLPISADLQAWTVRDAKTTTEARRFEEALRAALPEPTRSVSR